MENGDSDNASDDGDTDDVFRKISLEGFKKTKRKHCYGADKNVYPKSFGHNNRDRIYRKKFDFEFLTIFNFQNRNFFHI